MLAKEILTTPSLALPELAGAIARRSGFTSDAQAALEALSSLPNLVTVDIDADLALHAADIAADLSLRGADAVYVAVALARNLPLITWDHEVQERAARIVDVRPPLS
jgi:predicted nucleic acid-binding protein